MQSPLDVPALPGTASPMMRQGPTVPHGSVLLVIDVQVGFEDPSWGRRNSPEAENVCAALLNNSRARGWPVIHILSRA